jgi:acyl transferase domain-containing protein/acyl carrier protein
MSQNNFSANINELSSSQKLLFALDEALDKLEQEQQSKTEPIAIVGMSCRFPDGADNPDAYWQLLRDGRDAISEVPSDRWNLADYYDPNVETPGKMYTRYGAFLSQIDRFDCEFFGITPREAESLDPQQRLLLEVSWEALQDAGQVPERLTGSNTGVFVGVTTNDYGRKILGNGELSNIDTYYITGNPLNAIAGRLSYTLGLQGPSLAVDTACSSSLVSIHLACQSLRNRECHQAIAGGVNLILSPENTVALCQARMMSSDGRCKTFDASANGFVRGEGCGVVVLKRLSDAQADGNRILALIRSSVVNQDGASTGFTAPNITAQESLIQRALKLAQVQPQEIDYIEAHGTGTSLGDPIEVKALAKIFNPTHKKRTQNLILGSVKTNIGHLESAAGIAGLIKIVLGLQNQEIPPHLHFQTPNPHINWQDFPVTIPTQTIPWLNGSKKRLAGVSSFGASGTNAHLIIEEAPNSPLPVLARDRNYQILSLSAKSETALKTLAANYIQYLSDYPHNKIADICFSSNFGRGQFSHRFSVVTNNHQELQRQLQAYVEDNQAFLLNNNSGVFFDSIKGSSQIAFLCSGEGSEYPNMGQQLYETQPIFKATVDRCAAIVDSELKISLLSVLYGDRFQALNPQALEEKLAIFTLGFALAQLWESWGIKPRVVIGHDVGEYVAATIAKIFTFEDALKLLVARTNIEKFRSVARSIEYRLPQIDFISSVTGELNSQSLTNPEYWIQQINQKPNFYKVSNTLQQQKCHSVIEISCDRYSLETLSDDLKNEIQCLPSLRQDVDNWKQILATLAQLYVSGVTVDWQGVDQNYSRQRVSLPTYPFQRQRCWFTQTGKVAKSNDTIPITAILSSLHKGEIKTLTSQLSSNNQITETEKQLFPKLLKLLVQEHQQQLGTISLNDCLYQIQWQAKSNLELSSTIIPGNWLILADCQGIGTTLAQFLELLGHSCYLVSIGTHYQQQNRDRWQINPANADELEQVWCQLPENLEGVIHLWNLDLNSTDSIDLESLSIAQQWGCASVLYTVQNLVKQQSTAKLWLVTQGAIAIANSLVRPTQGMVWGLGKVIALEHPEIWGGAIDLDPKADAEIATKAISQEITAQSQEDRITYRDGQRYVPRLQTIQTTIPTKLTLKSEASYLITGGLGSLGLRVARWLIDLGARHLILTSRRKPSPTTQKEIANLEKLGAKVTVTQADVANQTEMKTVLEEIPLSLPLAGIIHAAGVLDDGILIQQNWQRCHRVLSPKVSGTWNLHYLSQKLPLDFFVCFSSVASLLGSPGQGSYAIGNSFMDTLAHYRHQLGLPILSINWGPWTQSGMAANLRSDRQTALEERGMSFLVPELGLQLLEQLITFNIPQVGVLKVDWSIFKQKLGRERIKPFLSAMITNLPEADVMPPETSGELLKKLQLQHKNQESEIKKILIDTIQTEIAEILKLPKLPEIQDSFFELGLDSLMAIELVNRLEKGLNQRLSATLLFNYHNIKSLVEYLYQEVSSDLNPQIAPQENGDLQERNSAIDLEELEKIEQISEQELIELISKEYENSQV